MGGKAAILTAYDPFEFNGGIETYTADLISLLGSRGVRADIYHTGLADEGHGFHNDYLGRLWLAGRKALAREKEYDLVVANAFYGIGYFPPGIRAYNIFHLTHRGFAEEIRDVVPMSQYLEWKFLWGEFCETASSFRRTAVAVSESVREELRLYYGIEDARLVHNCLDVDVFVKRDRLSSRKKWGIPEDAFVGLYVGRWDILKGCDILGSVMARMPHVYWTVVLGSGTDKRGLPAADNVKVLDGVAHGSMSEIYSAADFLLFPSRYEGFGYVLIEAMSCELPVITTNVGIAKTICKEGIFQKMLLPGFSCTVAEIVQDACGKIEHLREDAEWKEHIVREGRRLIEQEFSILRWRERIIDVLEV